MSQNLSLAGAGFIRHAEGFVDHWYADAVGVGTIGIGFTWASEGFREWWSRNRPGVKFGPGAKMTREEADKALIFVCAVEYGKAVGVFLGRAHPQHVFDATTSPVFNLGPGSLKWKWAAAVKSHDYGEAAARLRETGVTAKGKKLRGLVIRRREEAELMATGDYAYGSSAAVKVDDGVLVRGERGTAVADLQRKLATHGLYAGEVDGIFGYGTEAAVLAFQRAQGLTADGYAGPVTLAALGKPSNSPAEPVSPSPKPSDTQETTKPVSAPRRGGWLVLGIIAAGSAIAAFVNWLVSLFT